MPQGATTRVHGLENFLIACDNAGEESKREVRGTFRKVGDIVKVDAIQKLMPVQPRSAAGYKTVVRRRGIGVDQSLRRTAVEQRRRPKWAEYQMRKVLEPALNENENRVVREFEHAMDKVADHFERRP